MPLFRIKICGLTRRKDVKEAVDCGADAVGFIFGYEKSPRNLKLQQIRELMLGIPPRVSTVLVSPQSNPELGRAIRATNPSFIQIYGDDFPTSPIKEANIIQTVRPTVDKDPIDRAAKLAKCSKAIILDGSSSSLYSKEITKIEPLGENEKWKLAREMKHKLAPVRLILSGGLTPDNVSDAIRIASPYAVDVSSGVEEKPGIKDIEKIKKFVRHARSAII